MTDSTDLLQDARAEGAEPGPAAAEAPARARRRSGTGLAGMVLPELQAVAAGLGISGTARLRKGQLIEAIQARQGGAPAAAPQAAPAPAAPVEQSPAPAEQSAGQQSGGEQPAGQQSGGEQPAGQQPAGERPAGASRRRGRRGAGAPDPAAATTTAGEATGTPEQAPEQAPAPQRSAGPDSGHAGDAAAPAERAEPGPDTDQRSGDRQDRQERQERADQDRADRQQGRQDRQDRQDRGERPDRGDRQQGQQDRQGQQGQQGQQDRQDRQGQQGQQDRGQDDEGGGGRRRGRFRERGRNRNRDRFASGGGGGDAEPVVADDDVLVPVAGILDIQDNYAFIRTSGYLPGPTDVYVSLAQVRKHGLRRGDAVTGAVRQPKDGEQQGSGGRRDKFNALVRLDSVNGASPEEARRRPDFTTLLPLYPQDRLRLETEPNILTTRVIDLVMPIGKGQRALIVSPPKAGKTMVLQAIANAITTNNPECHLMVVLVDERPEEVTDMQRSVKGEVIASTFDRHPSDHTAVAELSIERAKRLVELGHDVVVLLDSITRLGRAYNLAAPASGRILSGGVDSAALYPPKRFLGAARNIENGGSLTIIATALVETGSAGDTVIFEEFKGTGNAELKLDRKLADKRIFPAIDVDASGTRKEEILLAPEELAIVLKLRRVLHALETGQSLDLLLDKMKTTRSNVEFLMQIQKTTLGPQE